MANLEFENRLYEEGYRLIAGTDEAGRGALAGPLIVAAVIFPQGYQNPDINDSKQVSKRKREQLYKQICLDALDYAIVRIEMDEIDRLNIYQSSKVGMIRALEQLKQYDAVLTDAMPLKECNRRVISLIHGDCLSISIAGASILAKVTRDRIMEAYSVAYPNYGFAKNMGYGTRQHMAALNQWGPCPIHRRTYEPMKSMLRPKLDL